MASAAQRRPVAWDQKLEELIIGTEQLAITPQSADVAEVSEWLSPGQQRE